MNGIKFEGRVPRHVQAALGRLHQNLGHPSVQDMTRHLRFAGAEPEILKACKSLRCEVCERNRHTSAPRPASLPSRPLFSYAVDLRVMVARTLLGSLLNCGGTLSGLRGRFQPTLRQDFRVG